MIILGIDPGTAETGYGVIECDKNKLRLIAHGSIKTTTKDHSSRRLNQIYDQMVSLLKDHQPEHVAVESLFFFSNAVSVIAVGQAIGVVKLAACQFKSQIFEYPPLRIKMVLTGKGRAEKIEVQSEVRKTLRLRKLPRPTHAADALAVAICHWQSMSLPAKKKK